ncbi:hypothetical protein HN51_028782 [Arachis hypogaea]|uniref:uncharacterized protein n=1 Tax=Arachis hypogaea TaxID=3818 RepID=UPI000DED1B97|nr:uncharacterized protein LOC112711379 [Arachis hypogaea]QHO35337.1 uncharacterized protein DS421_9g274610 [Arachis hypogaea]
MENPKTLYLSLSKSNSNFNHSDLLILCEILFENLGAAFRTLFSALPLFHDRHAAGSDPNPDQNSRIWPLVEDAAILLRCCMVSLTLLHSDQKFLVDKTRFLHRALHAFVSVDVANCRLRFRNFVSGADVELSDSCRPFLCALLEVFADELLRHQTLRSYLMLVDSVSSMGEKLFVHNSMHHDFASVLLVIAAHFNLSVSNENAFENFVSRLFSHCDKDSRFPGLSPAPAISLLMDPTMPSAPKMFQAHVISLVSEAIDAGLDSTSLAPNINWYLIGFQKAVVLYSMHITHLQIDHFYSKSKCGYDLSQHKKRHPTFQSSITNSKLNQVLLLSDNSCKISSKTKANILADCVAFMKGKQCIFADSCRGMADSILEGLIHRSFSQYPSRDGFCVKENTSARDICLLASILKFMGVSLMQAVKCLINSGASGCLKTMENTSLHEKYGSLISHVRHFQEIKFCLPFQAFLCDLMKMQQTTSHSVSKSMIVHFSGLLYISFSSELHLLAKGCIYVIMALMSLIAFEEGDLVSLGPLRHGPLKSCSIVVQSNNTEEGFGYGDKQSIYKVVKQFIGIQKENLRSGSATSYTCNGEAFLDCILGNPKELDDYDELVDFVVCTTGKDYFSWLNNRTRYRKQRHEKMIDQRKIKKKAVMNGKSCKRQKMGRSTKRQIWK